MVRKALVLNEKDNIATAVRRLESGESFSAGENNDVILSQDIPFGHKIALRDIVPGENIIKYGEIIGRSTTVIKRGEHVHVHNVEGLRGRGDKR
jgi:altronate dehydratase small subunit